LKHPSERHSAASSNSKPDYVGLYFLGENFLFAALRTHSAVYTSAMLYLEPVAAFKRAVLLARLGKELSFDDDGVDDLIRESLTEGLPGWLSQSNGYIYLAQNASWPGLYKVGCTRKTVEARMQALSSEGMLTPWQAIKAWKVYDAHGLEALAHKACATWRVKGELFGAAPEALSRAIDAALAQDREQLRQALKPVFGYVLPETMLPLSCD